MIAFLRARAADDVAEMHRHVGPERSHAGEGSLRVHAHDLEIARRFERCASDQKLEKQDPERVDVDSLVEITAPAHLLGRHVGDRTDDPLGDASARLGVFLAFGDAEVGHLGDAVFLAQKDVGRLEIAVNQPLGVRCAHAAQDHAEDRERELDRYARMRGDVALDETVERLALDELHHQVERRRLDDDGVETHHVGVVDARQGPPFRERARPELRIVRELGSNRLDDHLHIGVHVVRQIDDPHSSFTEHPLHAVLPIDDRAGREIAGSKRLPQPRRHRGSRSTARTHS